MGLICYQSQLVFPADAHRPGVTQPHSCTSSCMDLSGLFTNVSHLQICEAITVCLTDIIGPQRPMPPRELQYDTFIRWILKRVGSLFSVLSVRPDSVRDVEAVSWPVGRKC